MTIDELADMSGRSKSSVKTTLFRIRAELKKYLDLILLDISMPEMDGKESAFRETLLVWHDD